MMILSESGIASESHSEGSHPSRIKGSAPGERSRRVTVTVVALQTRRDASGSNRRACTRFAGSLHPGPASTAESRGSRARAGGSLRCRMA